MARRNRPNLPTALTSDALFWGLGIAFAAAVLITAVLTFTMVRDFILSLRDDSGLPALNLATPTVDPALVDVPLDQPLQPAGKPTAEPWDGKSRIFVLLMGLDYRDWEVGQGPPRTDTMILLTLNPQDSTAGMLSIPRDLWVNIPGYDYNKINTAYYLGEAYQSGSGGGPALAMETVSNFLGIEIQYYAQVDFGAFVRFIDEIDGVKIVVPEEITLDLPGDGPKTVKWLEAGEQVLPGDLALAYARNRDTIGNDFDRAQRQQQIILGIRDRILDFNMLPTLVRRAPALYREVASGINTNLTLDQVIRLAWMAKDIPDENLLRGQIGSEQVTRQFSTDGQDILVPDIQLVRQVRDEVLFGGAVIEPLAPAGTNTLALVEAEAARVSLRNGTYTTGLAGRTSEYLDDNGLTVSETGNADQVYEYTTIIDYTGKPYTLAFLADMLNVDPSRIFSSYDPESPFDIVVFLGNDWDANNLMP